MNLKEMGTGIWILEQGKGSQKCNYTIILKSVKKNKNRKIATCL